MAKTPRRPPEVHHVLMVRFKDGLATRNRLPLEHVIRVLTELKQMIETTGRDAMKRRGLDDATPDFGLELVGGFRKGSLKAHVAITKNPETGIEAAREVLSTIDRLGAKPRRVVKAKLSGGLPPGPIDGRLVTRLGNIDKVRELDKVNVEVTLIPPKGSGRSVKAEINDRTAEAVAAYRQPTFTLTDVTVFGKLFQLRDRQNEGDEGTRRFFGDLHGDDGARWRVEFPAEYAAKAAALFRRQVFVTGRAVHYRGIAPKLEAREFGPDDDRDYDLAFTEMFGASPELKGIPIGKLNAGLED